MSKLIIRSFEEGRDEPVWIELANVFYGHYYSPDFEPFDERDVEWFKNTPWWGNSKLLIAELSGEPVGFILSCLDRARERPKGYIWYFAVRPELEGSEVDEGLLDHAISWLSSSGAKAVQAAPRDNMRARVALYRSKGFEHVRTYSTMRLRPEDIPSTAKPSEEIELKVADPLKNEEELKIINALYNEAYADHFDFRPETLDETRAWLEGEGYEDRTVIAWLGERPVGYVVATISDKPPGDRPKRGFISSIGVLKPYRRRRIGTALMLKAVEWLISKGAELIELGVDDENPSGALAFYTSLGFRPVYKTLTFLKEL